LNRFKIANGHTASISKNIWYDVHSFLKKNLLSKTNQNINKGTIISR